MKAGREPGVEDVSPEKVDRRSEANRVLDSMLQELINSSVDVGGLEATINNLRGAIRNMDNSASSDIDTLVEALAQAGANLNSFDVTLLRQTIKEK